MDVTFTGDLTQVIPVEDTSQIGQARRVALQAATSAGFSEADSGRVGIVATELATNVLRHGRGGEIHVAVVQGDGTRGVEVIAVDRGPGFNLIDCLPDGFSTGGTRGEGLGAVKRQAQVMDMYADHRGAVVLARMYPKGFGQADIRFGAVQQAIQGETKCGDGWAVAFGGSVMSVMVVDGLGHGDAAHDAAVAATRGFSQSAMDEPTTLMAELNNAMAGTRGGAVAVAHFDAATESLRYAGIGNISGALHTMEGSRGLASHPGIVGVQARRVQPFTFPQATRKLLIMHSDGLQSRWNLRDYAGIVNRHPAVITALLYRDFTRGRDDVTVFAIILDTRP